VPLLEENYAVVDYQRTARMSNTAAARVSVAGRQQHQVFLKSLLGYR
jgi:hypothetical protein